MKREELRIGQPVRFGRPNGEKTLGEVVKLNAARAPGIFARGVDGEYLVALTIGTELLCLTGRHRSNG